MTASYCIDWVTYDNVIFDLFPVVLLCEEKLSKPCYLYRLWISFIFFLNFIFFWMSFCYRITESQDIDPIDPKWFNEMHVSSSGDKYKNNWIRYIQQHDGNRCFFFSSSSHILFFNRSIAIWTKIRYCLLLHQIIHYQR